MAIDGRVLASAGINVGQQIGKATEQFGQNVGGMLTDVGEGFSERRSAREAQELLQQYANDPAQLNALGQKYGAEGNDALSKVFFNAATQATTKRANKVKALETGGQEIQKEAQRKRAVQVARQKGDQAALTALNARALDPVTYLNNQVGSRGTVNVPAGGAVVDEQTGEVIYERPFKPTAETASKGIKTVAREDGSVTVLDADDGSVISTLDAPGKGEGDRDASLNLIAQTTGFIQEVDKLMDPGFMETGFIGGVTSAVPGTPAYDREKDLLSIRARLGFDQINEMKRLAAESGASGTGLGQISNIEFMSLQSTIDAIYVGMSGEAQKEALANIKKHLLNVQQLASGVAPADAIEWERPEYKAVGYGRDPDTGNVYYAPNGRNGKRYKLVDGKFQQLGSVPATPLGNTPVN